MSGGRWASRRLSGNPVGVVWVVYSSESGLCNQTMVWVELEVTSVLLCIYTYFIRSVV